MPCDSVLDYFTRFTHDLQVESIDITPTTTKRRDIGKCHGGSARLTFTNEADAHNGLKRFQESLNDVNTSNTIGEINVRWVALAAVPKENEKTAPAPTELSQEQILHRQRRAEKYARQRRTVAQKTDEIIQSLCDFLPQALVPILDAPKLDWSNGIPDVIDPMRGGGLRNGTERGQRKQAQVEAFLHVLKEALLHDDTSSSFPKTATVADLGSGAGNLSLPLAWFLKDFDASTRIVAVDINDRALERLSERANQINVEIKTMTEDLLNLSQDGGTKNDSLDSCSAIVSLHACGAASDLAIAAAVCRSVPFAISPCCIGKGKAIRQPDQMPSMSTQRSGAPDSISYPRSAALREMIREEDYNLILSAADYSAGNVGESASTQELDHQRRGKMAKVIVETDRLKWAEERGYYVRMMEIPRLGRLYPKRELLLGAKAGSLAASRISQLSSTQLCAKTSEEDEVQDLVEVEDEDDLLVEDRMDLGGFAGYLAPYALALVLSLGVTAAFLKFVLLDY